MSRGSPDQRTRYAKAKLKLIGRLDGGWIPQGKHNRPTETDLENELFSFSGREKERSVQERPSRSYPLVA